MTKIIRVSGKEIQPYFNELAQLRIIVFREYPYLYEGTLEYEAEYINAYINCPESTLFLVFDENKLVGATTTIPLQYEHEELKAAFKNHDIPVEQILYFGESMLLPEYRGHGIGHEFFSLRENVAREKNLTYTAFAAIERPDNHPRKPKNYRALHDFWQRMGYVKQPNIVAYFPWKDLDDSEISKKPLVFWIKKL